MGGLRVGKEFARTKPILGGGGGAEGHRWGRTQKRRTIDGTEFSILHKRKAAVG